RAALYSTLRRPWRGDPLPSCSTPNQTRNEHGLDRQLRVSKPERFARERFIHAVHFVEHLARLNLCDPVLGVTLTVTHTNFSRLLRDRLVRENADPDTTTALDVARHRTTGRFDLTCRQTTTTDGLEAVL